MIPQWLIAGGVWVLGLAVGSFLNVVIYRLPLDISLSRPARSFCPGCKRPIRWSDNLPVVGWLLLRGRCRTCGVAISVQYPLIEAASGLVFVMIYYLLAVAQAREGVAFELPGDAPLLAAWLVLGAAMIACAALDILSYTVDTRVTNAAMYSGIALYALWPAAAGSAGLAQLAWSSAALAAGLASLAMLRWSLRHMAAELPGTPPLRSDAGVIPDAHAAPPAAAVAAQARPPSRTFTLAGIAAVLLLVAATGWLWLAAAADRPSPSPSPSSAAPPEPPAGWHHAAPFERDMPTAPGAAGPLGLAALALFVLMTIAAGQRREVDAELHQAIEAEQEHARRMALAELLWLLPIIAAGTAAFLLVAQVPAVAAAWAGVHEWTLGGLRPVAGMSQSLLGLLLASAAGWVLRLVFTLAFGREAFGTGDIFILAAAGACAGWDIALSGLGCAVAVALAGWLLGLMLKQTHIIPFGPSLALGFLLALWLNRPVNAVVREYRDAVLDTAALNPQLLYPALAVLLAGGAAAVVLARLLRKSLGQ